MRPGAESLLHPAGASQRRYEALRAYFVDDMPAAEVADRFGYSTASVHQMATLLRGGKMNLFTDPRPGPKGPRKATGELRVKVLALRAAGHSVTEISAALTAEGLPVSAQTAWQILDAEGIPRLPRRDEGRRGPAGQAEPGPDRPAAGLARRRYRAGLRSRRAAAAVPRDGRPGPARPGPRGGLPLHQGAVVVAVGRHAAAGQVRPQGPRPPHRLAHRRRGPGLHPRADRAAQGHPPRHLLLARPPRLQPQTTIRAGHRAAAGRAGHRRGRVQLRLPRHPPPRRGCGPGKALRAPPLPAHPRRADLLRPGPRLKRDGLRQRRHHQGRAGQRDHRLRRLLEQRHRIPTRDCWSSTPSSPPTRSSTSSPAAASTGSPCASAARTNSPGSPPCPPAHGRPSPSPAPGSTASPASTRT